MRAELEQAIEAWQRATDELVVVVNAVETEQWPRPSANPGWSKKDLLAHLASGYVVRVALLESILETGRPDGVPDTDAAIAANIEARRNTSVKELLTELIATRGRCWS